MTHLIIGLIILALLSFNLGHFLISAAGVFGALAILLSLIKRRT